MHITLRNLRYFRGEFSPQNLDPRLLPLEYGKSSKLTLGEVLRGGTAPVEAGAERSGRRGRGGEVLQRHGQRLIRVPDVVQELRDDRHCGHKIGIS
ncbi:jg27205 [Pararge aegeria aegeria]|uniref:Jg27205 protein n=1 Tax=Pararge aegeria aegeria TaxID=348720 RepID=A0A8S4QSQ3_9NEOP|nr:jg27205 [Pararge aegeria aegeria]